MQSFDLSNVQISAGVAILCFVAAILLMSRLARHSKDMDKDNPTSLLKRLLYGDTLTEIGQRYRIAVFIALMFAFMNTIGSAVIFIATKTLP